MTPLSEPDKSINSYLVQDESVDEKGNRCIVEEIAIGQNPTALPLPKTGERLSDIAEKDSKESLDNKVVLGFLENGINSRDNKHGNTALHWAVLHENLALARALIKAGALLIPNRAGKTPLTLAQEFNHPALIALCRTAVTADIPENVQTVVLNTHASQQVDTNSPGQKDVISLEHAIDTGRGDLVESIVSKAGFNINFHNPLLRATMGDEEKIVRILLSTPTIPAIDINATEETGSPTALWIAAKHGNLVIVRSLLQHKDINVDYRCSKLTAEELADHAQLGKIKLNAQEIAAYYGHEEVLRTIQDYKEVKAIRESATRRRQECRQNVGKDAASPEVLIVAAASQREDNPTERIRTLELEIKSLREQNLIQQRQIQEQSALLSQFKDATESQKTASSQTTSTSVSATTPSARNIYI